ncbi:MAG TPA: hypothetical protein VLA42_19035 [Verrucomicrobiae bacterium]|nr:hypothetical protein [Verrucomicrobiae bacterium]
MATSPAYCFSIFSVLILAASVALPNLVVPNFSDLTIKTRHTSGDQKSADQFSEVRALYLKGSRQRTETTTEKPLRGDEINSAAIWQCDEKRSFFLNQRDKIYNSSVIENRSEQLKKARPVSVPQMSGADVTMTIDSVDTGERRQFEHYAARVTLKLRSHSNLALAPQHRQASKRPTAGISIYPDLDVKSSHTPVSLFYPSASAEVQEIACRSNGSAKPHAAIPSKKHP